MLANLQWLVNISESAWVYVKLISVNDIHFAKVFPTRTLRNTIYYNYENLKPPIFTIITPK